MQVVLVFLATFGFNCCLAAGYNDKRLLLNDPDALVRLSKMENLIQALTNRLHIVETELETQKTRTSDSGSTFVRWGRKSCNGTHSELVYSGYAAGQSYSGYQSHYGGAANYLCMPADPELSNITINTDRSNVYGTEYEQNIQRPDAANEDMPCALCNNANSVSSVMIAGRKSCYGGWKKEYDGLLASDDYGHSASSFICIDSKPEYVSGGQENKNGRLLYFSRTICGSLSCPPYKNNLAINCVVCSK